MFNKKLKDEIKKLKDEIYRLYRENGNLLKLNKQLVSSKENPAKFQVGQNVKEGVVTERRFLDHLDGISEEQKKMFHAIAYPILALLSLKNGCWQNDGAIKYFTTGKCWEYNICCNADRTERWIPEYSLHEVE